MLPPDAVALPDACVTTAQSSSSTVVNVRFAGLLASVDKDILRAPSPLDDGEDVLKAPPPLDVQADIVVTAMPTTKSAFLIGTLR